MSLSNKNINVSDKKTDVSNKNIALSNKNMDVSNKNMDVCEKKIDVCNKRIDVCDKNINVCDFKTNEGGIEILSRLSEIYYLPCGIASRALRKAAPFCVCALAESVLVVLPFASVAESSE